MTASRTGSYYLATAIGQRARPQLNGAIAADVCIIGAGYTGLSCALHLAKAGLKVVVLEAEVAGFGASGRNGGQVITGQRVDQVELERRYGEARARALWDLALEARSLVRSLIASHAIACDETPGHISAAVRASHATELEAYVEHLVRRYNYSTARYLSPAEMPAHVATSNYKGGLYDTASFHLHPLNYALGLARAADEAKVEIFENSRVSSVEHGEKIRLATASGAVTAKFAVYACNGYLGKLNPDLARTIMPISNYVAATEPLGEARARALIPSGAAIADTKFVLDYYRLSADHRLIFGGGETYGGADIDDAAPIVRPHILRVFPQLADSRIDYAWGGRLAITMPRLPHVGRLTPNLYFAQGYSGQGVAIATLVGKLIGEAITGQAARFDVYESLKIPPLPGGALLRQPLLTLGLLWYALRDRLG
ncbi:MAG: FAD-binding oxidoreductase [Alphaproteobacteria bacterium]|nr:FAD-binding oxidoreductase [Alphaproteobacteria bacterium]